MEMAPAADQAMEKVKKRYRKKKTKLEEAFPSYLQVAPSSTHAGPENLQCSDGSPLSVQDAFFGRDLLERTRQADRKVGPEVAADRQSGATTGDSSLAAPRLHGPSPSGLPVCTMKKPRALRECF